MDKTEFIKKYGSIYEHSPWVAEAAFGAADIQSVMRATVDAAPHDKKIALIKAHPDLACAPADLSKLTKDSVSEQMGAGLNQCTPEEFAEFQKLNTDYKKKFGFPFIIAVKGLTRVDILQAFRKRMDNDAEAEFKTAIEQIHKIAGFRLAALS
jgi:2-oxo-4-hydroxy-4-carboxy-5-ureidoimidazoline decarboxylase